MSKLKSARKIADHFEVEKSQIQRIITRKAEVFSDYENNVSCDRKLQRRATGNEELSDLCWMDLISRCVESSFISIGTTYLSEGIKYCVGLGV